MTLLRRLAGRQAKVRDKNISEHKLMGNLEALPELIGIKVRCHSQCIPGPEGPESQPELPEARVSPEALGRPLERAFGHSLRRLWK